MIRLLFLLLALSSFALSKPIDPLLSTDSLWAQTPDEFFVAAAKLGYEWTSSSKDSARVAGENLTIYGLPAVESIARFADGKLSEITVMLYTRGDAGDMTKETFEALVRTSSEKLNQATNTRFTPRGKDPKNAVKADGLIWKTEKTQHLLEFSFTKEVKSRDIPFRAEFVRLEITPAPQNGQPAAAGKLPGAGSIQRDPASGDVWLSNVPMVDQGEKGYCVVATTERVLRYYGISVDQQELAQAANASSEGGTNYDEMFAALKKLSTRLKVRVREVEKFEIKQILQLITEYDRAAKRANASPIPDQGRLIDIGNIYRAMDVEILRNVRTKNKADMTRFQRSVQAHIDNGTPLLWTVMLGKVPEPNIPQNAGGHMRLIIGYNPKKEEVLFSDSWGAGHELKRMSLADAWTITTGSMSIVPF